MRSLFGDEIPDVPDKRKRPRTDRAHAAPVGSGPAGRTCGECGYRDRVEYHDKVYQKCHLMMELWTHGPGSDIRCKDAACWCFCEE